jgi:HEAT repeat protein
VAWPQQDPADSLYKAGRQALSRRAYRKAVDLFRSLRDRYPRSGYAADSYYWEAFALYRLSSTEHLKEALQRLEVQRERHPSAGTLREARMLATRIRGQLARRGDVEAAKRLAREGGIVAGTRAQVSEEDEVRLAALNALMMMDNEKALPLLREVLLKRDETSVDLRRQAVMMLGRRRTPEMEETLLEVVRNDPDAEVKGMALIWLAQSKSDRSFQALQEVIQNSEDTELARHALIALAQRRDERSAALLREIVSRPGSDDEMREMAIMTLGQHPSLENLDFLRELYPTLESVMLRERLIYVLAMSKRSDIRDWVLQRALDPNEPPDIRRQALFMVARGEDVPVADLIAMYDGSDDPEMRGQLMYILSMRKGPAAVTKLMEIARNDPDPERRQQAIMWLGQSKDPRVAEFLMEIVKQ